MWCSGIFGFSRICCFALGRIFFALPVSLLFLPVEEWDGLPAEDFFVFPLPALLFFLALMGACTLHRPSESCPLSALRQGRGLYAPCPVCQLLLPAHRDSMIFPHTSGRWL